VKALMVCGVFSFLVFFFSFFFSFLLFSFPFFLQLLTKAVTSSWTSSYAISDKIGIEVIVTHCAKAKNICVMVKRK